MNKQELLLLYAAVCGACLSSYVLQWLWGTRLAWFIKRLVGSMVHAITSFMGITAGKYQDYIDIMNSYRREKSIVYKYHYLMNVSIESLGLRTKSNVQTVAFFIVSGSAILSYVLTIGMNSFIAFILFVTLVVFFHLLMVFLSRSMTIKRSMALMDAEDILCTSMEDGIQVAIDKNVKAIDPLVRYMFEEFQTDLKIKVPIGTALDSLNTKAGAQMDSFCQTALNHYRDNDPVVLLTFSDNIQRNAKRRIAIAQQQSNYGKCMLYYLIGMIATVIFAFTMVSIIGTGMAYFTTIHGRTCTVLGICTALLGFVASQIIFSGGVD